MKKLILGLLSALALLPGGMLRSGDVRAAETFAVQSPRRDHRANPHANCHGERYEDRRGRYTKDSWSVYYRGRKVEGASVSSFADLGGGYGKDNWTVYYRGWKVEGASASSFADLGGGYGKDNWTVFYEGRKLEGASAMSFESKGRGYGKDLMKLLRMNADNYGELADYLEPAIREADRRGEPLTKEFFESMFYLQNR